MNDTPTIEQVDLKGEPRPVRAGAFPVSEVPSKPPAKLLWREAAPWWMGGVALAAATSIGVMLAFRDAQGTGVFVPVLCFMLCAVGAWVDSATRRIPNVLTYPAILLGLGINCVLVPALAQFGFDGALGWLGSPGPREGLLGFLLCAGIGIFGFMSRGLGGGDVKLLAAVGAMIGLTAMIPVLLNTLVIAAVIGVVNWTLRGEMIARLQVVTLGVMQSLATRRGYAKVYPFRPSEAPFGLSLLLGLVSAQFIAVHEVAMQLFR